MSTKDCVDAKIASLTEILNYHQSQVTIIQTRIAALQNASALLATNPQVDTILASCDIELNFKD